MAQPQKPHEQAIRELIEVLGGDKDAEALAHEIVAAVNDLVARDPHAGPDEMTRAARKVFEARRPGRVFSEGVGSRSPIVKHPKPPATPGKP